MRTPEPPRYATVERCDIKMKDEAGQTSTCKSFKGHLGPHAWVRWGWSPPPPEPEIDWMEG